MRFRTLSRISRERSGAQQNPSVRNLVSPYRMCQASFSLSSLDRAEITLFPWHLQEYSPVASGQPIFSLNSCACARIGKRFKSEIFTELCEHWTFIWAVSSCPYARARACAFYYMTGAGGGEELARARAFTQCIIYINRYSYTNQTIDYNAYRVQGEMRYSILTCNVLPLDVFSFLNINIMPIRARAVDIPL